MLAPCAPSVHYLYNITVPHAHYTTPSAEDINLSLSYTVLQNTCFVVLYSTEGASGVDDPGDHADFRGSNNTYLQ